jgi:creatinine amidohydrolase/Fe(II)-dependent formamide hydrolase-like protein
MTCATIQWWDVLIKKPVLGQPAETHGGYAETALMLAVRPEAVKIEYAILSPTKQVDKDIRLISLGEASFRDGIVRLGLRTADVSDTGSMGEHSPEEVPGTKDYSKVTKELGERLSAELIDWVADFVKKFETFELPPIKISKEMALKKIKEK